ncbi:MAG: M3 family oligoendopeptidase [Lachnospiraceae bacterium]|nr:M3 family oligoendopeptidase [Lachnospiraceae bacterium]MCR5344571.1 M3 family oligoendopeptidase [Lachnospiraceae bacterium]
MNEKWSLDVLYKSYDDPKFKADFAKVDTLIEEGHKLAASLDPNKRKECIVKIIEKKEEFEDLIQELYSFIGLQSETDTTDEKTAALLGQLMQKLTETTKDDVICNKFIGSTENLDELIKEDALLKEYEFYLHETKKDYLHMLSDDVEDMYAKMNITGGGAWGNMFNYLTSTLEVDYEGKTITLPDVRNMAYDPDKNVRKKAYDAELAAYKKVEAPIAYSLNNIKKQANMITKERGYESALAATLDQARMKKETLDALWGAIEEYLPKFEEYMLRKAKILGYKNGLPWFELFAPIGKMDKKYTVEEARDMLINLFAGFSQDMADMMRRAFDESWIDFFPRAGKVGGAFCSGMPTKKQSRILTNFTGSLSDIDTLAHELGHAYHNLHTQDQRPLNRDYSMPVAETASTFNENVFMNFATDNAEGEEKLALLETQLSDITQTICDIYSRYKFETAVFEDCKNAFLFPETLKNLMLKAQKEAYGKGLDPEYLHPYMWACKSHYYSAGLSFYNFPYAFGALFSKGLYAMYKKEGASFVPKYQKMLLATTVNSVEDTAKTMGIDLTKKDFWRGSLELVKEQVDEFLELTKDM